MLIKTHTICITWQTPRLTRLWFEPVVLRISLNIFDAPAVTCSSGCRCESAVGGAGTIPRGSTRRASAAGKRAEAV